MNYSENVHDLIANIQTLQKEANKQRVGGDNDGMSSLNEIASSEVCGERSRVLQPLVDACMVSASNCIETNGAEGGWEWKC